MFLYRRILFALSCFLLPIIFFGCSQTRFNKAQGLIWSTSYHITYDGPTALSDSVIAVLNELDKSLNVFDSTSLVSRVNLADTIIVDRHFKNVYSASLKMAKESGGQFDPTLSPLITAWGFGPGHTPTADTINIDKILDYVGIDKTRMIGDTLIKDDIRINFNFSAVAKGYACDEIAAMLKRNKVTDFLIEIGGEIAVAGVSPSHDLWKISIDTPIESDSSVIHDAYVVLKVTDSGIATSGNYRNYHREGGKTLGHTISPKTGRPVKTDVLSATIIAPTAMYADAAATACMAAGSEVAKQLISSLGYEGLLILADSTTWSTPGVTKFISPS